MNVFWGEAFKGGLKFQEAVVWRAIASGRTGVLVKEVPQESSPHPEHTGRARRRHGEEAESLEAGRQPHQEAHCHRSKV